MKNSHVKNDKIIEKAKVTTFKNPNMYIDIILNYY